MKNSISFVFAACALVASIQCSNCAAYGGGSAHVLNVQSYSLGAGGNGHGNGYGRGLGSGHSGSSLSGYASSSHSKAKVIVQPLWSHEIHPGHHQYKIHHSAPSHHEHVVLPVVHSAPLAILHGHGSHGGHGGHGY